MPARCKHVHAEKENSETSLLLSQSERKTLFCIRMALTVLTLSLDLPWNLEVRCWDYLKKDFCKGGWKCRHQLDAHHRACWRYWRKKIQSSISQLCKCRWQALWYCTADLVVAQVSVVAATIEDDQSKYKINQYWKILKEKKRKENECSQLCEGSEVS